MNGAMREALIKPGTETFIQMFPKYNWANTDLRSIPVQTRGCAFQDEITLVVKGFYTYGECYYNCRVLDVIKMCGCIPVPMIPIYNATYCDLADLPCLIIWKGIIK